MSIRLGRILPPIYLQIIDWVYYCSSPGTEAPKIREIWRFTIAPTAFSVRLHSSRQLNALVERLQFLQQFGKASILQARFFINCDEKHECK